MQKITPSKEENKKLQILKPDFHLVSEMKKSEREFLNAIISRKKPKKVLELGVAAGSSSVVILNALKNIKGATLASIDISENYYRDKSKKTGFIVDEYPQLKAKWQLYVGGMALDFIDKIGAGIDLCLIDTVHCNPGEILDTLMVLPYLKKEAVIVYHDINLFAQTNEGKSDNIMAITNNLLMSIMAGDKVLPASFEVSVFEGKKHRIYNPFPNIGAVKLARAVYPKQAWELFNLLALPWQYPLSEKEINKITQFFLKHYSPDLVQYFKRCYQHQNLMNKVDSLSLNERRLIKLIRMLGTTKKKIFSGDLIHA